MPSKHGNQFEDDTISTYDPEDAQEISREEWTDLGLDEFIYEKIRSSSDN